MTLAAVWVVGLWAVGGRTAGRHRACLCLVQSLPPGVKEEEEKLGRVVVVVMVLVVVVVVVVVVVGILGTWVLGRVKP